MLQMVVQVMKEVRMRNLHDLSFPELILVSRYNSVNSFTCFHRKNMFELDVSDSDIVSLDNILSHLPQPNISRRGLLFWDGE